MESSNRLFLVNLYDGEVQNSFDDMDQFTLSMRITLKMETPQYTF